MVLFRGTLIFVIFLLAGCAAKPPLRESERVDPQANTIAFLLPKPESVGYPPVSSATDLIRNIHFIQYRRPLDADAFEVLRWNFSNDQFSVENYKAHTVAGREAFNVSTTYSGSLKVDNAPTGHELLFLPNQKLNHVEYGASGRQYFQFGFSLNDFASILKQSRLSVTFDLTSEFNTESVYGNFARLARRESYNEKDPLTGKIFKLRYWVRVADMDIPVNVEAYPYRNGSKVVVYARVPGIVSGNIVDFTKASEALKKEIDRIVKS